MPSRARLDEFIAVVEAGDHAGAIERYYTEDASMQENAAPPRVGRDVLVAHERAALARMTQVYSKAMTSVVEGDRVAIHWIFELTEKSGKVRRFDEVALQGVARRPDFSGALFLRSVDAQDVRVRCSAPAEASRDSYAWRCRNRSSRSSRRVNIANDPSSWRGHRSCGRSQ
jgi:hypothetical protein